MLPLPNRPVPAKPQKNSAAATNSVLRTPILASICDPMTAPTQNVIIMMLNVSPTAAFSRPNVVQMGAANMENA